MFTILSALQAVGTWKGELLFDPMLWPEAYALAK
jgi:hypothetical protein